MLLNAVVALAAVGAAAARNVIFPGDQVPLAAQKGHAEYDIKLASYDAGMFSPVEDLGVLSHDAYTTLHHPRFPNHSVRIKKSTQFCDGEVNAYTGYIDIEAKHLFFYFFESRNDPDKDDVIFWTNGGPGCSSSIGLFMELGPCRISDENGTHYNPDSWNAAANVFFVDQPVGVGYSYAEYGEYVSTTEEAAVDIAAFVAIFFENFSKFKGRPFHMSGESYGGRYIPVFASAVLDQNVRLIEANMTPINLQSIIIGNGVTDFLTLSASKAEMMCTNASVEPILPISTCVRMKQAVPRCQKWAQASCVDQFDAMNCGAAMSFCSAEIDAQFHTTGMNPYDMSKVCDGPINETLCYPVTKHISAYLSRDSVREALGVDAAVPQNFTSCSSDVGEHFRLMLDGFHPTYLYVAALLERGVRTLIYVGSYDWICNWVGNEAWTSALEWSGAAEFQGEDLRVWEVDGERAGRVRSKKGLGLTFATIEGAGHMVPYDKPKESLEMLKRWLAGDEF